MRASSKACRETSVLIRCSSSLDRLQIVTIEVKVVVRTTPREPTRAPITTPAAGLVLISKNARLSRKPMTAKETTAITTTRLMVHLVLNRKSSRSTDTIGHCGQERATRHKFSLEGKDGTPID